MKKLLKAKLNNHGAGILYALLVLLIVAAISSIIITGALANTSRTENRVEDEQLYLAAESVADILSHDWHGNLYCAFVNKAGVNETPDWVLYWSSGDSKETEDGKEVKVAPYSSYFEQFATKALYGQKSPFPKKFFASISAENFQGIETTAELRSPNYTADDTYNATGFPKPEDMKVQCIITAKYKDASINIEPYQMVITMTADVHNPDASLHDGRVAYINWYVSDIAQWKP